MVIHVVDDDASMRNSLAFLLEAAGHETRLYEAGTAFLEALPAVAAGCVVTDIRMPELDGIELLQAIRAGKRHLPVIMMTGHGDVALAVRAMKLGASDFIEKPFADDVLLAAIDTAMKQAEDMRCGDDVDLDPACQEFSAKVAMLSQRERQVFERIIAGDSNKVMARDLEISPRTIEVYRANVMTKLQARSISELVRLAVRAHLDRVQE